MTCYRMTLAYDGTDFCGWQIQPNGSTIQELLEKTLGTLLQSRIVVIGAGRTDAGVHALAQVAHFHTPSTLDVKAIVNSLNGMLPHAIRVLTLEPTTLDFHSRYSAVAKEYHYHLTLDRVQSPFHRLYRWHIRRYLDVDLMRQAAQRFVGTHDFTSFANEARSGCAAHDAVRALYRLDVVPEDGGVRLEFVGEGFLYKMVRNITGVLVEIACGKRPQEDIENILNAKDRRLAGQAAPSHGLFLVKVTYAEEQ